MKGHLEDHHAGGSWLVSRQGDLQPVRGDGGAGRFHFVADGYGSNYILKFDKNRKFVKKFGGPGKEEGKFTTCHGIAYDTRQSKPMLLVCDRNNDRVEYWDLDGNFVKVIQSDLRMPPAVNIRGQYAVVQELKGRVTVLDKDGNIVARLGDNPNEKQRANFGLPPKEWTEGICTVPRWTRISTWFVQS